MYCREEIIEMPLEMPHVLSFSKVLLFFNSHTHALELNCESLQCFSTFDDKIRQTDLY